MDLSTFKDLLLELSHEALELVRKAIYTEYEAGATSLSRIMQMNQAYSCMKLAHYHNSTASPMGPCRAFCDFRAQFEVIWDEFEEAVRDHEHGYQAVGIEFGIYEDRYKELEEILKG